MNDDLKLKAMVSSDIDPQLTEEEIVMLLETHEIKSLHSSWAATTEYGEGQLIVPTVRTGFVYQCTQAGTSDSSQPVFTEDYQPITDGSAQWTLYGTEAAHNLNKAAARGWLLKAGKVANRVDMQTDVTRLSRDQLYKHCMDMYKTYSKGSPQSIRITSPMFADDVFLHGSNIP